MRRYFSFAMTLAAALGFATVGWGQAGGGSGGASGSGASGGAGAAGSTNAGSAGAGSVGAGPTAGAGANTAGTAGPAGAAGTSTGIGRAGAAGAAGTTGTATGVGRAGVAGTRGGVGAAGGNGVAAGASGRTNAFSPSNNISQTPFFSDRGVRQQLNMNDNQFNTLNRAYQNAYGNYARGLNNLNSNLTPQQRAAQMQNLENDFYNGFNRSLDTTFTDPQTRTRFDQLSRQFQGFNAFNNPAIQKQLNLTTQQQAQIRQLAAQWRQQLQQNGGASTNGNISQAPWDAMMSQYYDQLNGILTPQQQQTWSQLTGRRYNFPFSLYGNSISGGSGTLATRPIPPNSEPRYFPSSNGTTANGTASTNVNGTSVNNPSSTTTPTGTSSTGASSSASGNSSGIGTSGTNANGTSVNNPPSTATPTGSSSTGTTGSAGAGTGGTTSGGNSGTSGASGSGS